MGRKKVQAKGFTLIELLAVIVILAIIALIAVPIILNIVGSSKKSAVVRSGELYLKSVETSIARENLKNQFNPKTCNINQDGSITCEGTTLQIEMDGNKPSSGTITIEKGKIVSVTGMILDNYELQKDKNERLIIKENSNIELNPQGTELMDGVLTRVLLNINVGENLIEKIIVTNTKEVPSNAIKSWDTSKAKDKSVMAWSLDTDGNGLYEVYIGGEGGVKASPTSISMFSNFPNLIEVDARYLDTSNVTNMTSMFSGCSNLSLLKISNWDTSNVTNMSSMFNETSIAKLDLSKWNVSSVTDMTLMFGTNSNLQELNLSAWDTSKVTNMHSIFQDCINLKLIDLSNWNTDNVLDMGAIFYGCSNLTTIDLSSFNTEKVTDMGSMFNGCENLQNIVGINNFNTSSVEDMRYMFRNCVNLTTLDLSTWDTSRVTNMNWMFFMDSGYSKLTTIDMRSAIFDSVTSYDFMFANTNALVTIYVKDEAAKTFIDNIKSGVAVIA